MVRHAIAAEDKKARRQVILKAAKSLFIEGDGSLPAASEIAVMAGLAKGTVYLYFRTKEEIFSALLIEEICSLLNDVCVVFLNPLPDRTDMVAAFLERYVNYLSRYPALLRLDGLGYGVLEKNLTLEKLTAFKSDFVALMSDAAKRLEMTLELADGRGATLLMRTFAMTRGLWQSSAPYDGPPIPGAEKTIAALHSAFDAELRDALSEYWRGALMSDLTLAHVQRQDS